MQSTSHVQPFEENSGEVEMKLCLFYVKILKEFYKLTHEEFKFGIHRSLQNIRSYKNLDIEEHETVSFEEKSYRIAYVLAYGIIHSIVVHDRFLQMLKNNPSILKRMKSLKKLNLCVLGAGPAVEVVAINSVLNDIWKNNEGSNEQLNLQLCVTIIDFCAGWEDDAKFITKCAEQNLCDSNNVKIDINFIEADLTKKFSGEVKRAIKKAHFVTMVKFISDVNDASYCKSEISDLMRNVLESMSSKSCLFYLDTAGGGLFKQMYGMMDAHPDTARIYGPCLYNTHILNPDTVKTFSDELCDVFCKRNIFCTSRISISCSAWKNIQRVLKIDEIYLDTPKLPSVKSCPDPGRALERKHKKKMLKKIIKDAEKMLEENGM